MKGRRLRLFERAIDCLSFAQSDRFKKYFRYASKLL
jgi:hypothetical protein